MHTMSKYIGGHSDIIGGVLIANDEDLLKKLMLHRELYGGILGPMEACLLYTSQNTAMWNLLRNLIPSGMQNWNGAPAA